MVTAMHLQRRATVRHGSVAIRDLNPVQGLRPVIEGSRALLPGGNVEGKENSGSYLNVTNGLQPGLK